MLCTGDGGCKGTSFFKTGSVQQSVCWCVSKPIPCCLLVCETTSMYVLVCMKPPQHHVWCVKPCVGCACWCMKPPVLVCETTYAERDVLVCRGAMKPPPCYVQLLPYLLIQSTHTHTHTHNHFSDFTFNYPFLSYS